MNTDWIKEDFGSTWKWLAEGWRHLSDKAASALTYFTPVKHEKSVADLRWGLLAADVSDHGDSFVVELEAPGLDREDIDVSIEDDRMIVTATKRHDAERTEGTMRITERAFGRFQRLIPLPEKVSASGATARYKRGVLRLQVPKAAPPASRKIKVTSA